jgi:serine protein kinase
MKRGWAWLCAWPNFLDRSLVMELKQILNEIKKQNAQLSWEGTFEEYFNMVVADPRLARLSHQRVYDAIQDAGTMTNRLGLKQYSLFADELFGVERAISQVVEYFSAAARGLDTRKRILLLMGPPASGKTTLANLLKTGLEAYTRADAGALYAIQGCPMQEEPLHLIPPEFREELKQKYYLSITGNLCPHCRWMLKDVYHGEIDKVKVTRVVLSEEMGIGVGTFVATDPGSQDLARLTGNVGVDVAGEDRIENFGKTFQLNGELNVANRGIMEFIEMFKLDERFLAVLLVLTEEHKIKAPGSGTIYADEAIIAHSNEAEYESMVSDKKTEGLQDRIMVVRIPYNLRVSEETRIYKKLLAKVDLKGTHIAPLSLPVASIFAVLSRLQPSERFGMSLVKKMRLYDGQFVERFSLKDVEELQEESPREGMIGISPRYVINQISRAVSRSGVNCLDPIDLLQTLWEGLEQSTTLAREERKRLYDLFQDTRREYDELAKREIQKAFVEKFDDAANSLIQNYVEGVIAYEANPDGHEKRIGYQANINGTNERMMRSLERLIDVQDYDVETFRHEIHALVEPLKKSELPVDYRIDARLEEAVVRKLCPDLRQVARVLSGDASSNAELSNSKKEVMRRLIQERGYEKECAQRLVEHVNHLLNSNERSRSSLPKALRWLQG